MTDQQQHQTSSLTATIASIALLLGLFNTLYILNQLPGSNRTPSAVPTGEYAAVQETISQVQSDLESMRSQINGTDFSVEELQLRQMLLALESVLAKQEMTGAKTEDTEKAQKYLQRVLMRVEGLEPPMEQQGPTSSPEKTEGSAGTNEETTEESPEEGTDDALTEVLEEVGLAEEDEEAAKDEGTSSATADSADETATDEDGAPVEAPAADTEEAATEDAAEDADAGAATFDGADLEGPDVDTDEDASEADADHDHGDDDDHDDDHEEEEHAESVMH